MMKFRKLPRGVIYHSLKQSLVYFFMTIWMPLNKESQIKEFEQTFANYCGRKYGVAFPFARTAIYFVLKNLNLPKGSEVLLPPITIKGIVDVVVELGLTPRYADIDPDTACFKIEELHKQIRPNTKAVIITPLFGLVPNIEEMINLFRSKNIFIIEDFSQCLNGNFGQKRIGSLGDVGVYSASSIKTLDTLGGGLLITDNESIFKALSLEKNNLQPPSRWFLLKKAWLNLIRNLATTQPFFSLLTFQILQVLRKFNPESALKQTGQRNKSRLKKLPALWFCNYTSLQAKIGLSQLDKVKQNDKIRIANAEFIKLKGGKEHFPTTTQYSNNIYWQLVLLTPNPVAAQAFFAGHGVDIATSSLELVCDLEEYPNQEKLPEAQRIHHNGVFIPCYPGLKKSDLNRLGELIYDFFNIQ